VAAVIGGLFGLGMAVLGGMVFLPLGGWVVTAVVLLAWSWTAIWPLDGKATAALSQREDSTRAVSDAILVLVSVTALLSVAFILFSAKPPSGPAEIARLACSVASVVLSWAVLHTIFTLKYAHQYHSEAAGVEFNQDEAPSYRDFAYLAFTVGMTFQVSDTNVTRTRMRSLVLGHSLLSYLFGAVIIAVTVNLLASLAQ
jgi:uncharacterized membrane protein